MWIETTHPGKLRPDATKLTNLRHWCVEKYRTLFQEEGKSGTAKKFEKVHEWWPSLKGSLNSGFIANIPMLTMYSWCWFHIVLLPNHHRNSNAYGVSPLRTNGNNNNDTVLEDWISAVTHQCQINESHYWRLAANVQNSPFAFAPEFASLSQLTYEPNSQQH